MKPTHHRFGSLLLCVLTSVGASAQDTPPASTPPAAPAPAAEQPPAANVAADLAAAADKLAAATSYAWSQTSTFGNMGARTTTGKKGSGGFMLLNVPGRDQEIQVLVRNGKAAMHNDQGWSAVEPPAEGQDQGGPGRFMARMIQNLKEPSSEAKELVAKVTDLKSENGAIHGTLGAEAASQLMRMGGGRRGGGGGGGGPTPPEITGAAGKVSFTISNGVLTGYEVTLTGSMNFNGEDREVNRVTKVEFTGVGSTSFDIPEAAAGIIAAN